MNWKEIKDMEATYLEYKEQLGTEKPINWLKSVVAFANTKGGHIVFGVRDKDHEFIGLSNLQEITTQITDLILTRIEPRPEYVLSEITQNERKGIDLEIMSGPNYPYYYVNKQKRQVFVRHGEHSEVATILEQNNLVLKGMNKTFDALPTSYQLSDVSFTLLAATFKKETGENFDLSRDLVSMRLITENGVVTNAGLLLCDQGYLTQSRIICTRWKGNDKGSVEGDALDDEEFQDASLITLLSNVEDFIRINSKNPWTIQGMRREENSDYPFKAVREVLVNALIHRDYQIQGAEVHVDMFDDRMEITSPGGMMNGSHIQDLNLKNIPSMRRNNVIADIFGRLHYMDRRGSGIRRVLNSYHDFIEQPKFYSNDILFLVTMPNRGIATLIEKAQLQNKKTQLQNEKTQLQNEKAQLQNKKTQLQNSEKYKNKLGSIFRKSTVSKLIELYENYETSYSFNREILASYLKTSPNYASQVLKKCKDNKIIRMEKRGVYYFNDLEK